MKRICFAILFALAAACSHQAVKDEPAQDELEFDPRGARIVATGKDRAWVVTVDDDHATLRAGRETLEFTDGEWEAECAAVWSYQALRETEGGEDILDLQISNGTCIDSTSGAVSPLSAYLRRGDAGTFGCAIAAKPKLPRR